MRRGGRLCNRRAAELRGVSRCSVFLLDEAAQQLWSVSTDTGAEIRIPKDKGTVALRREASGADQLL